MSEKFIVMRSSNFTAPSILKAANSYEEAYKAMIKDFVDIGEYRKPKIYSQYEYGAKALECTDCCDYRWSIEKVEFEEKKPLTSEEQCLILKEQLPDEIVAVVYDYKGISEENYLFTVDDFVKFVNDSEDADSILHKIAEMRNGKTEDFAFAANKTLIAWIVDKKKSENVFEDIYGFLSGKSNDDAIDMMMRNYDTSLSPLENIKQYNDWYFGFNANDSSKEIVDLLKTNSIFCGLMEETGGYIPRPYIDVLRDLVDEFNDYSGYSSEETKEIYAEFSKTIEHFDALICE